MAKSVFISYSWKQKDWVWDRLIPVLKAGGCEVLYDKEEFEAGRSVIGQMDETLDRAEVVVLVLSPDYRKSDRCEHERKPAIPTMIEGSRSRSSAKHVPYRDRSSRQTHSTSTSRTIGKSIRGTNSSKPVGPTWECPSRIGSTREMRSENRCLETSQSA